MIIPATPIPIHSLLSTSKKNETLWNHGWDCCSEGPSEPESPEYDRPAVSNIDLTVFAESPSPLHFVPSRYESKVLEPQSVNGRMHQLYPNIFHDRHPSYDVPSFANVKPGLRLTMPTTPKHRWDHSGIHGAKIIKGSSWCWAIPWLSPCTRVITRIAK